MFAIGNEELVNKPVVGKTIECPQCDGTHEVEYGEEILKDGTKILCDLISFYKCGEKTYLCGVNGKSIL